MKLSFAVERLYSTGWTSDNAPGLDTLPDGRKYPSVLSVQREFAENGLELSIKHNLMFNCYRATWHAADAEPGAEDDRQGTVIGACEREAAVYALAQLREALVERALVDA
jgi:hypothetical protein